MKKPAPETIELMLANGLRAEAEELIKQHNMTLPLTLTSGLSLQPSIDPTIPILSVEEVLVRFLTKDPDMIALKNNTRKLAPHPDSVLVRGQTGTGKELIARALHSNRAGPFVDLNCAGMPEHLIESELFGHVKGAFTGADSTTPGMFRIADKGTLFLDEIGELGLSLQAKLLRVLQERVVRKVGGKQSEPITCRIIAATHQNLESLVACGKFRKDLYWRLSTFELYTKPLSERIGDIALLVENLDPLRTFPRDFAWEKIDLGGNVRTVQQVVRRFQVLGTLPLSV